MHNIQEQGREIKVALLKGLGEWGVVILVLLVALACFGLGRLSALEDRKEPISLVQAGAAGLPALASGGEFVAAKTGTVYYLPWCGAAEKIARANQVWFKTEADAQKAGYRAAKNCKGLSS